VKSDPPGHDAANTGDLVLGDSRDAMIVELGSDGRLMAARERTWAFLRDRLNRAEVLPTGPGWALMRTVTSGGEPTDETDHEIMMAGTLTSQSVALIDLIGFLASGLQTGVLAVRVADVTRSVYLRKGDVVWAESTAVEEQIGDYLVRHGKITRRQLAEVLHDGAHQIGRACLSHGYVTPDELGELVQAQLTDIFDRLMASEKGLWTFAKMPEATVTDSSVHLPTQHLLMDACRKIDEMRRYREVLPSSDTLIKKAPDGAENANRLAPEAAEPAKALFDHLPATATVAELMRLTGRGEYPLTRLVFHLHRARMIQIVAATRTASGTGRRATVPKARADDVVKIYALVIREIFDAAKGTGSINDLHDRAAAWLDGEDGRPTILRAVRIDLDGGLDCDALSLATQSTATSIEDLTEPMDELMLFLLTESASMLSPRASDDLARRVKMIHAMVEGGPS